MASDREPRKFFELPPRSLQKSYFGDQNIFALQFQYIVTLANCNKTPIKVISTSQFQVGAFPGPLYPLKTDVSFGPSGLSGRQVSPASS